MNCPVCLRSSTRPALTGGDLLFESTSKMFNLESCAHCRCLFLSPMPPPDEIASFYPQQYWWSSSKMGALKKAEAIYRKIALHGHVSFVVRAAGRQHSPQILDVGCGSAALLALLKQRGFQVMGVDFSAEASRVAEVENGVRVMVGSLEDAAFPDESFDIVTLFHVMEHVPEPRTVLAEVARILKRDGAVVLQVPNIDSWQFKAFRSKWYGLDIPRHVIDYSKKAILTVLNDSGFEARRIKHFNLRDNAPALVSSLFPSLDPVSRAVRKQKHGTRESMAGSWLRHIVYLLLVICAYPIAILEAATGHGATLMIEAEKKL